MITASTHSRECGNHGTFMPSGRECRERGGALTGSSSWSCSTRSVWRRKLTAEPRCESFHVRDVVFIRLVAEVGGDLSLDRAAADGAAADSSQRGGCVVEALLAVTLDLVAAAIWRELSRV